MFALTIAPVNSARGVDSSVCMSQPRIQRLRYGSPGPICAPSRADGCGTSGQVVTAAAPRYATSGSSHRRMSALLQFAPEEIVGELGIRLAAAPLHHLADQETEGLLLPRAELRRGVGVVRNHVADDRKQRTLVVVL